MNVITKIAITTVPMSDCREPIRSEPKLLVILREGTGGDDVGAKAPGDPTGAATAAGGSGGLGKGGCSVCETVGWLTESMNPTYPPPAGTLPFSRPYPSAAMPGTSAIAVRHLVRPSSSSSLARVQQTP